MWTPWRRLQVAPLLLALSSATHAEAGVGPGALDLYGGVTLNRPVEVSISESTGSGTNSASARIDPASTGEFGARLQGWLPSHEWFGLGLDVGYFRADGPGVSIHAIPLSMLAILRAPLFRAADRPNGCLQPYAMGGVSFYMADVSVELEGMGASSFQMGWPLPGVGEVLVGPYLAGGLAWQPVRSVALFGEYRYSSFDVGFDTTNSMILPTMNGRVDTSVRSDHVLLGVSYRFGESEAVTETTGPR